MKGCARVYRTRPQELYHQIGRAHNFRTWESDVMVWRNPRRRNEEGVSSVVTLEMITIAGRDNKFDTSRSDVTAGLVLEVGRDSTWESDVMM